MFCKWCGMESAAADLCSWCHRPLSATTTETPSVVEEAPASSAPAAAPLVEEEVEEESPLAAGIVARPPVHRPAPAYHPAWAPVPRAGTPPAPQASAPTAPAPGSPTAAASAAPRPIIGIRRPGGASAPAGGGAPIGVRRPENAASSPAAGVPRPGTTPPPSAGAPRPPAPVMNRPAPTNRPTAPMPVPAAPRPTAPAGTATAYRDPVAQHPVSAERNGTGVATQTAPYGDRASEPSRSAASALAVEEEEVGESGGLADGIAAGKRPITRTVGVPALGTFTPANSKYYAGQVVDPSSGTHYDSATGRTTSGTSQQKTDDIVLQWDDPTSTPLHIGRFAMAFAGLMVAMAALTHIVSDYAAVALAVAMFAAGILLPVMRAVPFQSEDSDDIVWFVLLTLLFGPGIGLLIYSVKAFLLRDMNIAVLGLLTVSFLGYLVFQFATPFAPATPGVTEGFFNVMKLAPPWTQVSRYGYTAVLYNWAGLVAMIGWFVGNVFHKLDE